MRNNLEAKCKFADEQTKKIVIINNKISLNITLIYTQKNNANHKFYLFKV